MIVQSTDAYNRKKSAQLTIEQLAPPEYSDMLPVWDMCDDVFRGEISVKTAGKYVYQPESKKKRPKAWAAYLGRGTLPDYAASTLEKMCGILSSTPPEITLDGKAERLKFFREYATPYRDGLDALADRVRRHILRSGRYCLLLEPDDNEEIGFHINEYKCRKFLRAKIAGEAGETYAELILLDTSKIVYDTASWRDVYVPQITLLGLDGANRYYQAKFGGDAVSAVGIAGYKNGAPQYSSNDAYLTAMSTVFGMLERFDYKNPTPESCTELIYPQKYSRTLDRIPFVCINPGDLSLTDIWNPPLLKLCLQCIHILDADCTYKTALFMTGDPQPVVTGANKKDVQTGSDSIIWLPAGAKFEYVSPSGAGLAEQAQSITQMKADAMQMGVSLAGQENLGNTPVGTMELYRNSQTADLMRINQNSGKGIEQILRYAGSWLGMKADEVARDIHFVPSNEFASIKASAQECAAIAAARKELQMTPEEVRIYIERNGLADPRPWEEVKAELDQVNAASDESTLNSVAGAFGFGGNDDRNAGNAGE